MKKSRIVLASLLKPVTDTRAYEKMALTLDNTGLYEVHVVGHPVNPPANHPSIHFYALKPFRRLSWQRIRARLQVLLYTLKVKPQVLIISTPDLLIVAILNRILFGTAICYDLQENFYRNILYSGSLPRLVRWPLAAMVRLKERLTSPLIAHYFLAEKGYAHEMNFFRKKFTVVENKCAVSEPYRRVVSSKKKRLLFTGTIARSTGAFAAIDLVKKLHLIDPEINLTIIGYCALPRELEALKLAIADAPYILLKGGDQLVPHSDIVRHIQEADAGIIFYPSSPHTINSIPTKLYEYLAYQLPILIQPNATWAELWKPCMGAVEVDFNNPDGKAILHNLTNTEFYTAPPANVTWASEEPLFLEIIRQMAKRTPA